MDMFLPCSQAAFPRRQATGVLRHRHRGDASCELPYVARSLPSSSHSEKIVENQEEDGDDNGSSCRGCKIGGGGICRTHLKSAMEAEEVVVGPRDISTSISAKKKSHIKPEGGTDERMNGRLKVNEMIMSTLTEGLICHCMGVGVPHIGPVFLFRASSLLANVVLARRGKGFVIKVAAGTSAVGIGGLIILAFYFRKTFSTGNGIFSGLMKKDDCENIEAFLRDNMHLALKRYSFKDVTKMTNNFRDKLGEGGFGYVYKGKLSDGSQVAVKVLKKSKDNGEAFTNEVASISRTSHVNIVTLLGFCFKGHIRVLIYEFVPNGSLEKLIHEESALNGDHHLKWETLHQIAIGIARGLEYLHCRCNTRILHFDIKPHNILLDNDFCPKISDFGLAKLCPKRESIVSMTGVRGTIGYIAPEVFCRNIGRVSHKSDVYSYGMMILDMVGARKNINAESDHSSEYFPQWIYRRLELDEELGFWSSMNENDEERARKMIIVGLWCIQTHPSNRPPMYRVVEMLKGNLNSLEIPPESFLSSPPRPPADANIDFDSSSSLIL
ncbi:hypothetical protein SLEP1_g4291 [Rubroshorea leprosula]|uniref:Protein kinase domain-containing protein n=1 Tax=Rubroshorea leprosula TaxID=152421 RepID=A0AAV5HSL3_9ROSI|nr:hypothetical protein SLEP1_g4291 [Rubroshorea leprosula]